MKRPRFAATTVVLSVSVLAAVARNIFFAAAFVGRETSRTSFSALRNVQTGDDRSFSKQFSDRNLTTASGTVRFKTNLQQSYADANGPGQRPAKGGEKYNGTLKDGKARDSFLRACIEVRSLRNPVRIEEWMRDYIQQKPDVFNQWRVKAQIDFVKLLQKKRAYDAAILFIRKTQQANVKVCTTAIFGFALSTSHRHLALEVLEVMDEREVGPTSLTFIALLGSIDGPVAVSRLMKRIESYPYVKLTDEVFNSAIFACKRQSRFPTIDSSENVVPWQTALNLFQMMRRRAISPTVKTYHALLQVLGGTGQVQMAKSLLQQLHSTSELVADDRVWAAAINICADVGDHDSALYFIKDMDTRGHKPNLLVCSILLKAFAVSAQDVLALQALGMMTGKKFRDEPPSNCLQFYLPVVPPDQIALNTVISACAKAQNFASALDILRKMKEGEFIHSENKKELLPDLISYHNILKFCTDPDIAMNLVKEMRLSRRNRYGVVSPTSVTYAHAINACQQAESPSTDCAATLLSWAMDDGVEPTAYMYAPAIWAAQKNGDRDEALNFFIEMTESGCSPNSVAYNGVISALCDSGDVEHAILLYGEMKERGMKANSPVFKRFARAVQSTCAIEEQKVFLDHIFDLMDNTERMCAVGGPIFAGLISAYGLLGHVDDALELFGGIDGQLDAVCLRSILLACSRANPPRWEEAISILHTSDIVDDSYGPGLIDQSALSYAIMACSKANEYKEALTLLRLYGRKTVLGSGGRAKSVSTASLNALIAACGRCGRPDLSIEIISTMERRYGACPDPRSYRNAAIACNKAQHDELPLTVSDFDSVESQPSTGSQWWECALALLRRMREDMLIPDVATYSATISACESAGEWQRALGVLQTMIDDDAHLGEDDSLLNLYCFNAAISACEKGQAWVEALELYERMLEIGGPVRPNVVTLNSLLVALEKAGQQELAKSKYIEGRKLKIVNPWRQTKDSSGDAKGAMDLHKFSGAMAKAAVRTYMDGSNLGGGKPRLISDELIIITGKGIHSKKDPVLRESVINVLSNEYGVRASVDESNWGRISIPPKELERYILRNQWKE